MQKKLEKKTVGILKVTEEKSRKEQDPDPDPYQHVADPEHWSKDHKMSYISINIGNFPDRVPAPPYEQVHVHRENSRGILVILGNKGYYR